MLPDPLHPALVHLPIAFAVLAPLAALVALLLIRAGRAPVRLWTAVVALQALLAGSAWLAVESGEREEERVERVVPERFLEEHEEAGERFLWIAVASFLVSGTGLLAGGRGSAGRIASVVAALGLLAAGVAVGHSGGELVFVHGAAEAYRGSSRPTSPETPLHE